MTYEHNSRDSIHEMWYEHCTNVGHPNVRLNFSLLITVTQQKHEYVRIVYHLIWNP